MVQWNLNPLFTVFTVGRKVWVWYENKMISFTESQQKLPSTCLASLINPMRDRQHYNIMLIELNYKVLQVLDKTTGHGSFTMIGYDKEGRE